LALFKLDDGKTMPDHLATACFQPTKPEDLDGLDGARVFAIGYNSDEEQADWQKRSAKEQARFKKLISPGQQAPLMPNMDESVLPSTKSITLGRLQGNKESAVQGRYLYTISGWHGISGSLIAGLWKEAGKDLNIRVFGLCKLTHY